MLFWNHLKGSWIQNNNNKFKQLSKSYPCSKTSKNLNNPNSNPQCSQASRKMTSQFLSLAKDSILWLSSKKKKTSFLGTKDKRSSKKMTSTTSSATNSTKVHYSSSKSLPRETLFTLIKLYLMITLILTLKTKSWHSYLKRTNLLLFNRTSNANPYLMWKKRNNSVPQKRTRKNQRKEKPSKLLKKPSQLNLKEKLLQNQRRNKLLWK